MRFRFHEPKEYHTRHMLIHEVVKASPLTGCVSTCRRHRGSPLQLSRQNIFCRSEQAQRLLQAAEYTLEIRLPKTLSQYRWRMQLSPARAVPGSRALSKEPVYAMVARTTKKLLAPMTIHNIIASRSGRAPTDFIVEGSE